MPSGLQRVRLVAASGGLDVDSAPSQEGAGKALKLQNLLTGEAGRTRQRGGIEDSGLSYGVANKRFAGSISGNDKVLIGQVDVGNTDHGGVLRDVEPNTAPYRNAAANQLSKAVTGANAVALANLQANTIATIASAATGAMVPYVGTRLARWIVGFPYSTANDNTTDNEFEAGTATIGTNERGGKERLRGIHQWDTSGSALPTTDWFGPYSGQDIRLHYNKLLVLGGRHPSTNGLYIRQNVVWYTRELAAQNYNYGFSPAGTWTGSTPDNTNFDWWMDPNSPTDANELQLPGDPGDFGVGFGSVGRNLAVFKRRSIHVIQGFDAATWQIRSAVIGVGCLDRRSIVEANSGAYFLSQRGFMYFDGVQLHDTSKGLHRSLVQAGLAMVGDEGPNGGFAVGQLLDQDYILLTIGKQTLESTTPATPVVYFCGIYHIPSNSWSTFTSTPLTTTGDAPVTAGRTENKPWLADHEKLYRIPYVVNPDNQTTEANRGKDNGSTIETIWHSKVVELASPFEKAKIHRLVVDYEWIKDEGTADSLSSFDPDATVTTRPRVQIVDGGGTVLRTFYLPQDGNSGTEAREVLRQRFVYDYFSEVHEIQVRIEYPSSFTATALVACSILDVWVEYEVDQQRRNA